jgi:hypothetical protein
MAKGFLYLVVILDWVSRAVLAWRLSNTLGAEFCVEALEAIDIVIAAKKAKAEADDHPEIARGGNAVGIDQRQHRRRESCPGARQTSAWPGPATQANIGGPSRVVPVKKFARKNNSCRRDNLCCRHAAERGVTVAPYPLAGQGHPCSTSPKSRFPRTTSTKE